MNLTSINSNNNVLINNNSNINNTTTNTSNNIQNNNVNLSDLQIGQIFSGEVLDCRSDGANILLSNGQEIQATFNNAVNICIGEVLNFIVVDNKDNQVVIKPFYDNNNEQQFSANDEALYKALDKAMLPSTDKNIDVVSALLNHQMAVDKKSIINILSLSYKNPDADINDIVLMAKHNIDITKENIHQFENYKNGNNSFIEDLKIINELIKDNNLDKLNNSLELGNTLKNEQLLEQLKVIVEDINENNIQQSLKLLTQLKDFGITIEDIKNGNIEKPLLNLFENLKLLDNIIKEQYKDKKDIDENYFKMDEKKDDIEIVDLKNNILKKDNQNINLLNDTIINQPKSDISKNINNIFNNMNFINELNKDFIYTQLPLKFTDNITKGDLYIYKDRRKKNFNATNDEFSLLLHLEMEYLGDTDILIKLKQKSLKAEFTLESDQAMSIILSHTEDLVKKLNSMGFNASISSKLKEKDFDFVDDFIEKDKNKVEIKRVNFDMRA